MVARRPERTFVVDDDSAIRDIIHRYLAPEGYQVAEAVGPPGSTPGSARSVPT
jgi:CheY-like chemotaxis protein